jgi:NADH-quinone oxidoreductase subunit J
MSFLNLAFYLFATVAVFSAAMVITVRNPVQAALFLVLTFFSVACVWVTLEAEFLAIVLVLVYVGAVMVLFLFVVMMLDVNIERMREGYARYLPAGILVGVLLVIEMGVVLTSKRFAADAIARPAFHPQGYSNTKELGAALYTDYLYPFEIAAIILLVAIVAAIALTLRRRPETKYQKPSRQIAVRAKDRLRVVNMASEQNSDE